jgi:para-aminobenzoate synthetase
VNGTADLSVVIRTLVATPAGTTIGAGGAIVAGSDPDDELQEMLLKARALLQAVGGTVDGASAAPDPQRTVPLIERTALRGDSLQTPP